MDKIQKALQKLTAREKKQIHGILSKILSSNTVGLDIKKLKTHANIFRVRKGKIRIIFSQTEDKQIRILAIERRTEKTYRNL